MIDYIRCVRDEGELFVTVNGDAVPLKPSLMVFNHSPSGFEIGYGGSGPAQLALAILLMYTDRATAVRLHQDFKWRFLAKEEYQAVHTGGDVIVIEVDIPKWIEERKNN